MGINNILNKKNTFVEVLTVQSNFDFEKYEIDEITRDSLIEKEQIARKNMMQIKRNTIELGKTLAEAQKELANKKNGAFIAWFENLGLKKDYVYREIKRYEMFLKYDNERVKELPIRALKYISNENITEAEVIEVIEAEDPSKKIREQENKKKVELTDREKIIQLEYKILQAQKNIEKWKIELEELKK